MSQGQDCSFPVSRTALQVSTGHPGAGLAHSSCYSSQSPLEGSAFQQLISCCQVPITAGWLLHSEMGDDDDDDEEFH